MIILQDIVIKTMLIDIAKYQLGLTFIFNKKEIR